MASRTKPKAVSREALGLKRAEFERLLIYAQSQAEAAGGVDALPEVLATAVTVAAAQQTIDRGGGLLCFFEIGFDEHDPYRLIADAYRRIGATEAAEAFERAVKLFPFEQPHLHRERRLAWLEEVQSSDEHHEIWDLSDELIESPEVWSKLKAYVEANRDAFTPAGRPPDGDH
ncbi:MAG: DUF4375 domain-containing protein [Pseudomonadota bacterium]